MRYLRQQARVPVWFVGTSLGSVSVAAAAIRIRDDGPDGIVLTSSVVNRASRARSPRMAGTTSRSRRSSHHEKDECKDSLFKDVPPVVAALTSARRKELITFRDGGPPKGDPCEPWGYHGYPAIESRVVTTITDWVKATK
jgi:hypothetical protein